MSQKRSFSTQKIDLLMLSPKFQFLLYSWSRMNKNTSDILNEAERRMSFDKGIFS